MGALRMRNRRIRKINPTATKDINNITKTVKQTSSLQSRMVSLDRICLAVPGPSKQAQVTSQTSFVNEIQKQHQPIQDESSPSLHEPIDLEPLPFRDESRHQYDNLEALQHFCFGSFVEL